MMHKLRHQFLCLRNAIMDILKWSSCVLSFVAN